MWTTAVIFWRKTALADSLDVANENRRERKKGQLLGFQLEWHCAHYQLNSGVVYRAEKTLGEAQIQALKRVQNFSLM